MPYALVPMIDVRPSRRRLGLMESQPLGLDQGGNAIHLGRRRALIWTPQEIRDRRATTLCDDGADRLLSRRRRHLQALLPDRVLRPHLRFGEMVGWSLKTPPRATWGPLYPAYRRNQLEVWLGPGGPAAPALLWRQDADARGPHSQDIQDLFTRANAALSGSTSSDGLFTWSLPQGISAQVNIVSNQLVVTRSGADNFAVCLASLAMDTADHYAQVDLISRAFGVGGQVDVEVVVRVTNGTGSSDSGYAFSTSVNDAGSGTRRIYNFVTDAAIANDTTATTSGLHYLELNGSTYTCKVAGSTIFTGTNTTYPGTGSQRKAAIDAFIGGDNANVLTLDSFRAADLGGAPPPSTALAEDGLSFQRISTTRLITP